MPLLTMEQIEELRKFDTPTVSNAIERFNLRPRTEGFMSPQIKCVLSYDKPIIGYACTAKVSAMNPPTTEQAKMAMEYYAKMQSTPSPKLAVIQDIDPTPIGSFWGEVQASVHKALGATGVITNGGVRDLDEVKALGFSYFASCVLVSHGYIHVEAYDCAVVIGGLTVKPGDLLHADKHGVVLIPNEIAPELAEACRKAAWAEEPVINGCRKGFETGIDLEELRLWRDEMAKRRSGK